MAVTVDLSRDVMVMGVVLGSLWAVLAASLVFLATLFFTVGFATVGWGYLTFNTGSFAREQLWGLWMICTRNPISNIDTGCAASAKLGEGWYAAAQGLSCTALLLSYTAFGLSIAYLAFGRFRRDQRVAVTLCGLCLLAGVIVLTAATTFGAGWSNFFINVPPDAHYVARLSYSFALAIMAALFHLIGGAFITWELMTSKNMIPV